MAKQDMKELGYKSAAKKYGRKLVCHLKPAADGQIALCSFEGKTFAGTGKNNKEALSNVLNKINELRNK